MTVNRPIPLVDLGLQHSRLSYQIQGAINRVIAGAEFILGPAVARFEEQFSRYCGVAHAVGVANGTDAIELALRAVGVEHGDEVIIPANTFVATAEAVARCGAVPVLVDCDASYLIDADEVKRHVTQRTRAVVPVHLYGQPAPVEKIADLIGDRIPIVEDAAQAQGAVRFGTRVGGLGVAAATSFYPGKNLGAYGDAGAVMTSSDEIASSVRSMRNHGGVRKYEHVSLGVNSRLDGIQAAVLSAKLEVLDAWNDERRQAAKFYDVLLGSIADVIRPQVLDGNEHVWHLYVVRVPERDRVLAELNNDGIGAGIHYPAPVHLLPAFSYLDKGLGSFPLAERYAGEIISLPIYPGITQNQQEYVVQRLRSAIESRRE